MFDHLLESSQRDDSNKWSNIEFGEEIRQVESIEVHFTHLIWSSEPLHNRRPTPIFFFLNPRIINMEPSKVQ